MAHAFVFFLNPIEIVWTIMKRHMRYKKYTFEKFITHVQEAWDSVQSLIIKKLTSMSRRIQQCQEACGGWFGK
ncbi:Transposable_element Tcb2 transposase [Hexamita inflata]|uniref:Transposable_element Tcb2 transposase n=1 Tax=Hexamita inflata TaxID=28002 RepID=A0ABP1J9Z0_9EUKA